MEERHHIARLLVSCPDRHWIVATVAGFLAESDGNILSSDQHSTDPEGGTFFMRMVFRLEGLLERRDELESTFAAQVAEPLEMDWRFAYADETKRTAVLASREDHCLLDLLWRRRRHELETDIVAVISHHPAHYVTEELDAGPIIEQDVARVSHRLTVEELEQIGRHIERIVLARAVRWHVEDRVLVHENRTVVF